MIRTFIYGSCVSRDTFEYLRPQGYALTTYVARQSLLSAYSRLDEKDLPPIRTTSAFQHRMIEGDWASSLPRALARARGRVDLLLWDLCDERLGVLRLPSGHYVTRSVDTIATGLDGRLKAEGATHLPFGSARHQHQFGTRLAHFRQRLLHLGLLDRTLVLAPDWASRCDDGSPTPPSFGLTPDRANAMFDGYHQAVEEAVGVPVLRFGADEVEAASGHQWGRAPFHYTHKVYEQMVRAIARHVERGAQQGLRSDAD